mmetsp:Transcript_11394/g.16868  ORF Transcript_11394/g.16868 Transcript_11394/m.16868 type:complete len:355 (-) Transcript_11394:67-1131(-)
MFPNRNQYPIGEIQEYHQDFNMHRADSEELKEKNKDFEEAIRDARAAAVVHRDARRWLQENAKPGANLKTLCEGLEERTRRLVKAKGLKAGIGFPTGCSVNNCAAHFTPNPSDTKVFLKQDDVVSFDFGVHVNGRIIDSAWTQCFDDKFQPLLDAVQEATNTGLREAGIDVTFAHIGESIQEVMESKEITLNGKTIPIKCVRNLNGHSIAQYKIHGGETIPIIRGGSGKKMQEDTFYAIETFGTTGKGIVRDDGPSSHFMMNPDLSPNLIRLPSAKKLLHRIRQTFNTLPFCRRYLDEIGEKNHLIALKSLVNSGHVTSHPPLSDIKGSYTAQFEHTFVCRPTHKEIISRGDDY